MVRGNSEYVAVCLIGVSDEKHLCVIVPMSISSWGDRLLNLWLQEYAAVS